MNDTQAAETEIEDTSFGVGYVYCMQHLGVHSTGWCAVPADQKIPLDVETREQGYVLARERGWPIFDGNDQSSTPRPRWNVFGQLLDPSGALLDDRNNYLS